MNKKKALNSLKKQINETRYLTENQSIKKI